MGKSISKLYLDAKVNGGLQFIFTLLRAEGWTNESDQIRALYGFLQGVKQGIKRGPLDDATQVFQTLTAALDTYNLIYNLVANAAGETYRVSPLPNALDERGFGTGAAPKNGEHIDALLQKAKSLVDTNPEFYKILEETYNDDVKNIYRHERDFDVSRDKEHLYKLVDFLHDVLKKYYRTLRQIGGQKQKVFPSNATFDVFELLANEVGELFGIDVHHSDGSISTFKRYADRTEQGPYSFTDKGEIIILNSPTSGVPMWMLNKKPFYEIGFPGRYNNIGEWKPINYPGNSQEIQQKTRKAAESEADKRIEGCLFYVMATCHHAVEFVVKSNFTIPYDFLSTSVVLPTGETRIQLHKIKMPDVPSKTANVEVYDGTAFLPAIDVETIGNTLDAIGSVLNRIAFRVDGRVEWKIKYNTHASGSGLHHLSKGHFDELGEYLMGLKGGDAGLIDTAISWYTTAKNSTNTFTKYLNYYIAVESLAVALADGEMVIGEEFGLSKPTRQEKKKASEECIKKLHDELYESNPISFVQKAYSEGIGSLRAKTELSLRKIFGDEHAYVREFLDKTDGKNMYDLRNDLAHGNFNHIDRKEAYTIRKKLGVLEDIAYHFIMKLSLGPNKEYKRSSSFSMSIPFGDDPRNYMVVSNMPMKKDWKIQWEWLD